MDKKPRSTLGLVNPCSQSLCKQPGRLIYRQHTCLSTHAAGGGSLCVSTYSIFYYPRARHRLAINQVLFIADGRWRAYLRPVQRSTSVYTVGAINTTASRYSNSLAACDITFRPRAIDDFIVTGYIRAKHRHADWIKPLALV